jgi:Tol biopolymer transport system component
MKRVTAFALIFAAIASACGAGTAHPTGGKFLVYTKHLNSDAQALWIARLDGTHPRRLVRHGLFGAVSPDGRWVAYSKCLAPRKQCEGGNAPFALFLVPTSGGKARLLAQSTTYPSWSPKSDRIVGLRKNVLVSISLDGKIKRLEKSPAIAGWSFSPDGKWLVYAEARQHTKWASDLFVVPVAGGVQRQITRGRDILPIWGPRSIAFSRYPESCAYARRIWRVQPDGKGVQQVTETPPKSSRLGMYYGFDPIGWTPNERTLLAGLATEWGAEAIRIDVATGAYRRLSGYALNLSHDGRFALVQSGGVEAPQTIASVRLADGRRRVLAHGDVAFPSWNR